MSKHHKHADVDSRFDDWRVDGKVELKALDPAATPFLDAIGEDHDAGRAQLETLTDEIDTLQELLYANGQAPAAHGRARSLLVVLQGLDTSGKDGTARGVFGKCSPLGVRAAAFKAPSAVEAAHDILWRVHAVAPRAGEVVIFNRSHYEDVLVPVVAGRIDGDALERRYADIVAFERLLRHHGTAVVKCFLHISKDEQRQRLQARLDEPSKRWKFQPSDLDTRAQWGAYRRAYEAALAATSTETAPWYVIPADHKLHRNLMIATLVRDVLRGMRLDTPKPDFDPASIEVR